MSEKQKPKFVDLIANPDGSLSTKRTAGWICMFFTFFLIYKGGVDFDILFLLMGFVLGAFGLTTTENIAYFNNLGKKSPLPSSTLSNNSPYIDYMSYNQHNYNSPNNYNPYPQMPYMPPPTNTPSIPLSDLPKPTMIP